VRGEGEGRVRRGCRSKREEKAHAAAMQHPLQKEPIWDGHSDGRNRFPPS